MKKEDFEQWINNDLLESEAEKREWEAMTAFFEQRMKTQLQERLQGRRVRQRYFRLGFGVLAASILSVSLFFFYDKKTENADKIEKNEPPIPPQYQAPEKPILKENDKKTDKNLPVLPQNRPQAKVDAPIFESKKTPENNLIAASKSREEIGKEAAKADINFSKEQSEPIVFSEKISPVAADTEYVYIGGDKKKQLYRPSERMKADDLIPTETVLDLSKRKLTAVPPSVFEYENLEKLTLARNQITDLPEGWSKLNNLTELNLGKNRLREIPKPLTELNNLTHLSIPNNRLKKLPDSVQNWVNMSHLDLSFNSLSALPEGFSSLKQLRFLNIEGNAFFKFPTAMLSLTSLEELDLSRNRIEILPENIDTLANLRVLDLGFNQLKELPESIGNLTNLTRLDLRFNQLSTLPEGIKKLTKLHNLHLMGNKIPYSEVTSLQRQLPDCDISW